MSSTANSQAIIKVTQVSNDGSKKVVAKDILPPPTFDDVDIISRRGNYLFEESFAGDNAESRWREIAPSDTVEVYFDPVGPKSTLDPESYVVFKEGEESENGGRYREIGKGAVGDEGWEKWTKKYPSLALGATTTSEELAQLQPLAAGTSVGVPSIRVDECDAENISEQHNLHPSRSASYAGESPTCPSDFVGQNSGDTHVRGSSSRSLTDHYPPSRGHTGRTPTRRDVRRYIWYGRQLRGGGASRGRWPAHGPGRSSG